METHRVLHDFGELTYKDIGVSSLPKFGAAIRTKPYPFLMAAFAFGVLLGYFLKRK